jgi:hypothetical protein
MLFVLPRQPKVQREWDLQQLREVWTKTFKSSATADDDVEMTVEGEPHLQEILQMRIRLRNRCQMRLSYESQVRVSTVQRYGNP